MLFKYNSIDKEGNKKEGSIDAVNKEAAIKSLQKRELTIISIESAEESEKSIFNMNIKWLERVPHRDLVILSRQIATLFEAQVSALKIFQLISQTIENDKLRRTLVEVTDDLQAGSSIADALDKHPGIFSNFYVSMVRSGEESGRLDETFLYLADYMERTHDIYTKARNALIYPAFVVVTFVAVIALILTVVIPKIGDVIEQAGQEPPVYTKIVIGVSNFLIDYGILIIVLIVISLFFAWRYSQTENGRSYFAQLKLSIPYIGSLYKRLYLSRIADTLSTMLNSGVAMVRAIEVAKTTVGNKVYEDILQETKNSVKEGGSVSDSLAQYEEIPQIMVGMIKVGEESGGLGDILSTLSKFYRKEVNDAVDTLVDLIEPALIVGLGLAVGVLMAAVLMPIYNLASGIG